MTKEELKEKAERRYVCSAHIGGRADKLQELRNLAEGNACL